MTAKGDVPELILAFKEQNTREQAVEALGKIGAAAAPAQALPKKGPEAKAAVVPLSKKRNDPSPEFRSAVQDAMDRVQKRVGKK